MNSPMELIGKIIMWGAGVFFSVLFLLIWLIVSFFVFWLISAFLREKLHDLAVWWNHWRQETGERRRTVFREVFMDKWLKQRTWSAEWSQKKK